ncbi:hypothetical protein D3C81_1957710 [compost metagenome]
MHRLQTVQAAIGGLAFGLGEQVTQFVETGLLHAPEERLPAQFGELLLVEVLVDRCNGQRVDVGRRTGLAGQGEKRGRQQSGAAALEAGGK